MRKQYFRFSLKGLFFALTLFSILLGWNVSIVRERKALLRLLANEGAAFVTCEEGDASASRAVKRRIAPIFNETYGIKTGPSESASISIFRRWLGDEPILCIILDSGDDLQYVQAAFPEAIIAIP